MNGVVQVKKEIIERLKSLDPTSLIDLSSTDSDSDSSSSSSSDDESVLGKRPRVLARSDGVLSSLSKKKKKKTEKLGVSLPLGFLDPLPPKNAPSTSAVTVPAVVNASANERSGAILSVEHSKQFWRAGDFTDGHVGDWDAPSGGMDHVRVHPRFLHSNATSHKWVLGAFAELLDNSLDEICNGATFVNVDMLKNVKDGSRMLLIEDNGGGMDPDKMRQCMSLGYSAKSKMADTIGQYGNGFKTSTMRLGADVIVFSRCCGQDGKRPTQSIGLLSYTFLRSTGKEDIVVPMLDYEIGGVEWKRMVRSSASDWNRNVEAIVEWSPFSSEAELLQQFNPMKDHGTRIIIYNLWEDDQRQLELDFDADQYDIQIRGVNRDEKNIQMAKQFPNSKHFLTYRHSLRSYASILYLRIPPGFRIILRGKDVEHHNVVNDLMMTQEITYRPTGTDDGVPKDSHMVAVVTIGFVKDAEAHVDVQGFNVYHKNRLIKPFWRIWNPAGSDGRGVIGVLEANFVEPAHDKQGFERTIVLSRLESRLVQMQKTYWRANCHKIGYSFRGSRRDIDDRETSPTCLPRTPSQSKKKNTGSSSKIPISVSDKFHSQSSQRKGRELERFLKTVDLSPVNGYVHTEDRKRTKTPAKSGKGVNSSEQSSLFEEDVIKHETQTALPERQANGSSQKGKEVSGNEFAVSNFKSLALIHLKEENRQLSERLRKREEDSLGDLLHDLQSEKDRCRSLEMKLEEATLRIEELNKEQESIIDLFSEERKCRDIEEENLRKKLQEASTTIQDLLDKVRQLETMKSAS